LETGQQKSKEKKGAKNGDGEDGKKATDHVVGQAMGKGTKTPKTNVVLTKKKENSARLTTPSVSPGREKKKKKNKGS